MSPGEFVCLIVAWGAIIIGGAFPVLWIALAVLSYAEENGWGKTAVELFRYVIVSLGFGALLGICFKFLEFFE